jgi:hypothetical protein
MLSTFLQAIRDAVISRVDTSILNSNRYFHPFAPHTKFAHTFDSFHTKGDIQTPHISKIRLLEQFLQPLLKALLASVLELDL